MSIYRLTTINFIYFCQKKAIRLSIKISYQLLGELILSKLMEEPIEIMGRTINIKGFRIKSKDNKNLIFSIKTDLSIMEEFDLQIRPELYHQSQEINLEDIDIKLIESNFIGKSLMVADKIIINYITKKVNPIPLVDHFPKIQHAIDEQLEKVRLEKNIAITIQLEDTMLNSLEVQDNNLFLDINNNTEISIIL